jgi:putative CocE/NonD family hydrolase
LAPSGPSRLDEIIVEYDRPIPLSDGVRLSADIYRPSGAGRFPVIVSRTPYDNSRDPSGRFFAERGYVYVTVDVRGRYDSQGSFTPYASEGRDGSEVIQWAAEQPWSNGRVGTTGGSYLGFSQWLAARERPPALKAMVVMVSPVDYYESPVHTGGAFNLGGRLPWAALVSGRTNQAIDAHDWAKVLRHLPLATADQAIGRDLPAYRDWVTGTERSQYWARLSVEGRWSELAVPVYHMGGWYDEFVRGPLRGFTQMRRHGPTPEARSSQRLLIGPWTHALSTTPRVGVVDFGAESLVDLRAEALHWFDRHLRGSTADGPIGQPVRVFDIGAKRWRSYDDWPPSGVVETRWYLSGQGSMKGGPGGGRLDTIPPGDSPPDRYRNDPANPTPTLGGATCCVMPGFYPEIMAWGPQDQRPVEERSDVLVYSTVPLDRDVTVVGPVKVRLHAASSARDTDFTAKLVDVHPDGTAINLADGIVRARYRESATTPTLLEPGRVYQFEIDLAATATTFLRGHRIRLEIASNNFPWYDRNPNTGGDLARETKMQVADQTVYHAARYPSSLSLLVLATP